MAAFLALKCYFTSSPSDLLILTEIYLINKDSEHPSSHKTRILNGLNSTIINWTYCLFRHQLLSSFKMLWLLCSDLAPVLAFPLMYMEGQRGELPCFFSHGYKERQRAPRTDPQHPLNMKPVGLWFVTTGLLSISNTQTARGILRWKSYEV